MDIQDSKEVWVAWTNTDLTEGRGYSIPKAVCEIEATAIRLGRKGNVQGSNCTVSSVMAVRVSGQWLIPGQIVSPEGEDKKVQVDIDDKRDIVAKMREAGFSDDDIKAISGGQYV